MMIAFYSAILFLCKTIFIRLTKTYKKAFGKVIENSKKTCVLNLDVNNYSRSTEYSI